MVCHTEGKRTGNSDIFLMNRGDHMAEQLQYLEAVTHYIEAGENMKAVHAAIQGRQWSRALEILEQQRDENDPEIAKHYKLLGKCFFMGNFSVNNSRL